MVPFPLDLRRVLPYDQGVARIFSDRTGRSTGPLESESAPTEETTMTWEIFIAIGFALNVGLLFMDCFIEDENPWP